MNVTASQPVQIELTHGRPAAAAMCVAALAALGGGLLANDTGTRIDHRTDLRFFVPGTRFVEYGSPARVQPFVEPTRMERIAKLAGLSRRQWATVFGVSHTMIGQWTRQEPDRPELDSVLAALEDAYRYHPDLKRWLMAPLPGMQRRPIDLLQSRNWRAFRGAIRARQAPPPALGPAELLERRQADVSWAVAEPAIVSAD